MLNRKQNKFWKIQAIYAFLQTYEYDEVVEDFKLNIDEDEDKSEMLKDFESIVKYLERYNCIDPNIFAFKLAMDKFEFDGKSCINCWFIRFTT